MEEARDDRDLTPAGHRAVPGRDPPVHARRSRTRCCPASRTGGSSWSPRPPRTRRSRSSSPLLSRSLLLTLRPLTDDDVARPARPRACPTRGGSAAPSGSATTRREHLVRLAGGDARRALTALEAAAGTALERPRSTPAEAPTAPTAAESRAAHDHRRGRRARARPGRRPLRPGRRPALRRRPARSSSRCAAPTSTPRCTTSRGCSRPARTRGSSPAASSSRRARTSGWPTRRRCRPRSPRRRRCSSIGMPEARIVLGPRRRPPRDGAQVERRVPGDQRGDRATSGPASAAPVPPHLRDSHYAGAERLGHGQRVPLLARRPARRRRRSSTRRTTSSGATTTARRTAARSAGWPSAWSGCVTCCAADGRAIGSQRHPGATAARDGREREDER